MGTPAELSSSGSGSGVITGRDDDDDKSSVLWYDGLELQPEPKEEVEPEPEPEKEYVFVPKPIPRLGRPSTDTFVELAPGTVLVATHEDVDGDDETAEPGWR